MDKSSDVWIGDSGASSHMTNDASRMYYLRLPSSRPTGSHTSDGIRQRVEYIGNIDVIFHESIDEPITLFDVLYVPGMRLFFLPPQVTADACDRSTHSGGKAYLPVRKQ